jgi:hypothetical protein
VIREEQPVLYREMDGVRQPIAGQYVIVGTDRIGFQVDRYDTSRSLIIDPVLSYSTYLGGTRSDEGTHIVVDSGGNVYVTGGAQSPQLPDHSRSFSDNVSRRRERNGVRGEARPYK